MVASPPPALPVCCVAGVIKSRFCGFTFISPSSPRHVRPWRCPQPPRRIGAPPAATSSSRRLAAPDGPAYAIQSNRVAEKTQLTSGYYFFYCPDRKGHNLTYQVKIFPWTAIFLSEKFRSWNLLPPNGLCQFQSSDQSGKLSKRSIPQPCLAQRHSPLICLNMRDSGFELVAESPRPGRGGSFDSKWGPHSGRTNPTAVACDFGQTNPGTCGGMFGQTNPRCRERDLAKRATSKRTSFGRTNRRPRNAVRTS